MSDPSQWTGFLLFLLLLVFLLVVLRGASSSHLSQDPVEKEKLVEILGFVTKGIRLILLLRCFVSKPFVFSFFFYKTRGSRDQSLPKGLKTKGEGNKTICVCCCGARGVCVVLLFVS